MSMELEDFEAQLRQFIRRRPFLPFTIYFENGERIDVDVPHSVAFNGGSGAFIAPDEEIYFFNRKEVRNIAPTPAETTS